MLFRRSFAWRCLSPLEAEQLICGISRSSALLLIDEEKNSQSRDDQERDQPDAELASLAGLGSAPLGSSGYAKQNLSIGLCR